MDGRGQGQRGDRGAMTPAYYPIPPGPHGQSPSLASPPMYGLPPQHSAVQGMPYAGMAPAMWPQHFPNAGVGKGPIPGPVQGMAFAAPMHGHPSMQAQAPVQPGSAPQQIPQAPAPAPAPVATSPAPTKRKLTFKIGGKDADLQQLFQETGTDKKDAAPPAPQAAAEVPQAPAPAPAPAVPVAAPAAAPASNQTPKGYIPTAPPAVPAAAAQAAAVAEPVRESPVREGGAVRATAAPWPARPSPLRAQVVPVMPAAQAAPARAEQAAAPADARRGGPERAREPARTPDARPTSRPARDAAPARAEEPTTVAPASEPARPKPAAPAPTERTVETAPGDKTEAAASAPVGSEVESKPSSGPAPAARGGWAAIAAKAPPPVAPPSPKPVVSREASSKSVASSQPSSKADDRRGQGRVGRDREPGGKERPRDKEGRDRPRDREREGGGRGRVDRGDREDRGERGEGRRGEGRGEGRGQRGRRDGQPGWRGSDASVEQQMEDGAQDAPAKVQERVAPAPRAWSAAAAGNVVAVQAPSDRFRPQQGEPEPVRSAEAAAPAPTPAPTPAPAPAPAPEPTPAPASVAVPPAEPAPVAKAAPAPSEPQARAEPAPQPATPARAEPAPPAPARPEGGDAGQEQADEGEDAGAEEGGEGEEAELEEGEVELGYRRDMSWDGVVKSVLCYTAKELLSLQNGPLALLMPGKLSQILQGPMGKLSRTGGGVHSAPVRGGLPRNDSWKNRPSPRGGGPGGFGGMAGTPDGMWEDGRGGRRRGGRGGGGGGFDRNMGGFSGRWEAPQVQLHKSAQAFKLGQVRTDDPEEEARQKAFKSVLNKLTPENFERLTFKLLETPIPRKLTLEGLVDQIFDKALLEPTFSELYAKLCKAMQDSKCLPVFGADGEALPGVAEGAPTAARQQVYDFRKALLNKCQQEFEAGIKARNEHMQSLTRKDDAGETAEHAAERKQTEEENFRARKRMLGNIQFIGHLFHHGMLIERTMHTCFQTLLQNVESPEPEDVEALCKLMVTIGEKVDMPNNREVMNVYFRRIRQLRENEVLESRIRFMLQDLIELRERRWEVRRKVEGPKKIHEVHQDAMRSQMGRGPGPSPRFGDRPGGGFGGPRGGDRFGGDFGGGRRQFDSAPVGGFGGPPMGDRFGDRGFSGGRPAAPMRSGMGPGPMGPGGPDFGRTAPRPPPREVSALLSGGPRSRGAAADGPQRQEASSPAADSPRDEAPEGAESPSAGAGGAMGPEEVRQKARGMNEELHGGATTPEEALKDMDDAVAAGAPAAAFLEHACRDAMVGKGRKWNLALELAEEAAQSGRCDGEAVLAAAKALVSTLAEDMEDSTYCAERLGQLVARMTAGGWLDAAAVLQHALVAGEEPLDEGGDYGLVDSGHAAEFVAHALRFLAEESEERAAEVWGGVGKPFTAFMPSFDREDAKALEGFKERLPAVAAFL